MPEIMRLKVISDVIAHPEFLDKIDFGDPCITKTIFMKIQRQITEFLALSPITNVTSYTARWRHADAETSNTVEVSS